MASNYEGRYIFENKLTSRYLLHTDKPSPDEGIDFTKCVGADYNYNQRAEWKIIPKGDDTFLVQNIRTKHYLFQPGSAPTENEGGWASAPVTCGIDDPSRPAALWKIVEGYIKGTKKFLNVETKRYINQTGDKLRGDHESEEGWAQAPNVVGADGDYYAYADFSLLKL